MVPVSGISPFLRLGIYLYETQKITDIENFKNDPFYNPNLLEELFP